jgi:hypothetical protein
MRPILSRAQVPTGAVRSRAEPVGRSWSDNACTRGSRRCRVVVRRSFAVFVSDRHSVPNSAAPFVGVGG